MNRDQWIIFYRLNGGWPAVCLLADFETARHHIVESMHGCSGVILSDGTKVWAETRRDGLYGTRGWGEKPVVSLPWKTIREWVDSQPPAIIEQAKAFRAEWGVICRDRTQYDVGYMPLGPSYWDKTVYGPKTQRAQNAIECDERDRVLRLAERALIDSLAPSDEPMDLLEILAVGA